MAWIAVSGSMNIQQDKCDDHLRGFVSPGHSSISQELNRGSKKRAHHYIVKDEVGEDEFGEELSNMGEKKPRLTVEQVKFLEMSFNMDLKLEPERKALIAKRLGIRPRQVAIWFQNRRARWKNKQMEQDYEALKAKYEAALKEKESISREHEAVMEENKKLLAEVGQLMVLLKDQENHGVMEGGLDGGLIKEQQMSGKSELMSPTKSVEDLSETQDSGQSYEEVVRMDMIGRPFGELDSGAAYSVKFEAENAPLPDDVHGNFPVLVQLAATGFYFDEGCNVYLNYEDQFSGLTWCG